MIMKRRAIFLVLLLAILWMPANCGAEWKRLDGKHHQNEYGTQYYMETNMTYADGSSTQTPIVLFWGKTVFHGKNDPVYAKLINGGCPPDTAAVVLKYRVDINNKKAALVYGILYDAQGRILSTDEQKKFEYQPIQPGTGAEAVWLIIREMHAKGAIRK